MMRGDMVGIAGRLLVLCVLWGLCSRAGAGSDRSGNGHHGRHSHHTARVRIPRLQGRRETRICSRNNEHCDPGFYKRSGKGVYHTECVPCPCNDLSLCEDYTGRCLSCQFNTAGDHCERCKEGYYGNATQRTCRLCPCPFTVTSNSFATSCKELNEGFVCVCKPGYAGERCERCAPGYYGNPTSFKGSCQPCKCDNGNGNSVVCDPKTGECKNCMEPNDQCQECDKCEQTLLNDLEAMDTDLDWLQGRLKNISGVLPLADLKELEKDIAATKDLVRKYSSSVKSDGMKVKELEADVSTLHSDIHQLREKANRTLHNAQAGLENVIGTYRDAEILLSDARRLVMSIQDLLEQLKNANFSGTEVAPGELARMLTEARRMVREMELQNCSAQREAAQMEWEESLKLLHYIENNMTEPWVSNQDEADRIGSLLNQYGSNLRDLQEALRGAADNVGSAARQTKLSTAALEDLQERSKGLEKDRNEVAGLIAMASGQLQDIAKVIETLRGLKMEYERLEAQFDGARTDLIKKVNAISQAASKEPIVVRAEEHAEELDRLAGEWRELVKNAMNSSDVRRAMDAIGAYKNITDAINAAEEAARQAKEAAEKALSEVKKGGLPRKAKDVKGQANDLLTQAQDAQKDQNKTVEEQAALANRLDKAQRKTDTLQKDLASYLKELAGIKRDDIGAILDTAKANVGSANDTITNVTDRLDSIRDDLDKMNVTAPNLNLDGFLEDVNNTLRNLTDTLDQINSTEVDVPPSANMSESIRRVKELIQQARDAANRIPVPMDFSGDGYVELRPPTDLEDLKAYTDLVLSLQRPETPKRGDGERRRRQKKTDSSNMFVFYLGNRNTSKDYIGMMVEDNILYSVYKLGGSEKRIEVGAISESPSNPAIFDKVNFRRIYQDAKVDFIKSSSVPVSKTSQGNSARTFLQLDPGEAVFYMGGYPQANFTPPDSLRHAGYTGCMEFSSFNSRFMSLYNFRSAININKKEPCKRRKQEAVDRYFEGTGYAKGIIKEPNDIYRFFQNVRSHSENALLFYMGNERGKRGDNIVEEKSAEKLFPLINDADIGVIFLGRQDKLLVRVTGRDVITAPYTKEVFQSYYIGGLPPSLRERDNITTPPFKGCMKNMKVDNNIVQFEDELGVGHGCSALSLAIRDSEFSAGGYLSAQPGEFRLTGNVTISLGFRTTQNGGFLLKNKQGDNRIELLLDSGHVVFKFNKKVRKSKKTYKDGKWHYLTAEKRGSRIGLWVDEDDVGQDQASSPLALSVDQEVQLGPEFQGCLTNLYMRRPNALYQPEDLSFFNSNGDVSLGFCPAERPPLSILANPERGHSARR
ncbi:hypothetical protein AGOR_G00142700 [Albula goreensis]|uniref:Laminin subunit alpha-3-like n=1 Tax=Albula goreensis TaxID=1534307 RepID=A0A8T3D406_9TELE|nr:hypothetical protein AGOR_G00142700 [Albula goreensis]